MDIEDPSNLTTRKRLGFLAKDFVLYGGAAALNRSFALITFPLLARHFSVGDYGVIDAFTAIASLMTITLVFGQDSAVARFFYEYKDVPTRRQLVTQSLIFQLVCMLAVLPLLWMAAGSVAGYFHASPQAGPILKLVLMQVPFLLIINFSENLLKWTFSRTFFLWLSVGAVLCRMAVLLVALVRFDIGVQGVFAINLVVSTVFGVLGLFFIRPWLTRPQGFKFLKDMLPFALPLGVICTISSFAPVLERAMVTGLFGKIDLGLYAAGAKLALLVSLPIQALQMAWGPFSLAIHKEPNAAATYNWVLKGVTLGLCVSVLLLSAGAKPLLTLMATDRFAGATVVVFPLAMGLAMQAVGWIPAIGISVAKKTHLNLQCYLAFVVVSAAAIYVFARAFGLVGIAYGAMAGHGVKAILESYFGQKAWPIEWMFGGVVAILSATIAIGICANVVSALIDPVSGILIPLLSTPPLVLLGWKLLFTVDERQKIWGYMISRLQHKVAAR